MVGNIIENNMVTISGKVISEPEFSHEVYGEGFYLFYVDIPRLSSSSDKIPITISERLTSKDNIKEGTFVEIEGQFRSYNNNSTKPDGSKLILTVFAREITFINGESRAKNPNQIYLNGYICKKPTYRTTPFRREITDLLIAVNRPYNKSDYIPCIAWGRNARFCQNLNIGENIKIWGRIQSREYQKKINDEEVIVKTAYEVSVTKMEVTEEGNTYKSENMDGSACQEDQVDSSSMI